MDFGKGIRIKEQYFCLIQCKPVVVAVVVVVVVIVVVVATMFSYSRCLM